ncbi:ATP-binding protein [Yersinia enterocolitica]|nr:ATP-binding protein [Yersinia enterocolitica]
MFKLDTIKNHRKDDVIVSIDNKLNNESFYTLITGENGCGKSTLLSKAINSFLFINPRKSKECQVSSSSKSQPSRIIAICNARYNKFALKKTFLEKNKIYNPDYYIQADPTLEVGRALNEVIQSSLREITNTQNEVNNKTVRTIQDKERCFKAFSMIGIHPEIRFNLELNVDRICRIKDAYERQELNEPSHVSVVHSLSREFLYLARMNHISSSDIEEFFNFYDFIDNKTISLGEGVLHFDSPRYQILSEQTNTDLLRIGIAVGFIAPTKIKVQRDNSLKWVSHHDLSSGQQSLLLNAILISIFAKKNSLICIDEPENSLHPEWQINYMKFLDCLCPSNLQSHIFIATHSPQIISGLQSNNGCIVSLLNLNPMHKNNKNHISTSGEIISTNWQELHSASSYRRKSAAHQLVEIFKSPGFDNEAIINKLLLILTKQTKKIEINYEDENFIDGVQNLIRNEKIDDCDPVLVMYKQIKAIANLREF